MEGFLGGGPDISGAASPDGTGPDISGAASPDGTGPGISGEAVSWHLLLDLEWLYFFHLFKKNVEL